MPEGIIQARLDMGALAVNFSGNTTIGADTYIDNVQWSSLLNVDYYLDDIVYNDTLGIINNSWPGGLRIILQTTTGDGGSLQFTPTPGPDHFSAVDETPPSGTDNLQAASSGLVDELTLADCPEEVYSVAAVEIMAFGRKASSNPPTRLSLGLKLAGSDYYSEGLDMATSQYAAKNRLEVNLIMLIQK